MRAIRLSPFSIALIGPRLFPLSKIAFRAKGAAPAVAASRRLRLLLPSPALRVSCLRALRALIRLPHHHPLLRPLSRHHARPRAVILIHQRDAPDGCFKLLQPRIARRVVFQVNHHELAATALGCHIAQNGLHFVNGIREDAIVAQDASGPSRTGPSASDQAQS